jgi:hypothetical protein
MMTLSLLLRALSHLPMMSSVALAVAAEGGTGYWRERVCGEAGGVGSEAVTRPGVMIRQAVFV